MHAMKDVTAFTYVLQDLAAASCSIPDLFRYLNLPNFPTSNSTIDSIESKHHRLTQFLEGTLASLGPGIMVIR